MSAQKKKSKKKPGSANANRPAISRKPKPRRAILTARQRKRRSLALAILLPPFFAIVVGVGFGPGWGVIHLLAGYAWCAVLAFGKRRQGDWMIRHTSGLFVLFGYLASAFTYLVFAVTALLAEEGHSHWSPWLCLGISALVGAGATGAMWPMQLGYYARLRGSER